MGLKHNHGQWAIGYNHTQNSPSVNINSQHQ